MTSYQGGHNEYFKYMRIFEVRKGATSYSNIWWWWRVILPEEIRELARIWNTKIYSPDDGRSMGLQGMINDLVKKSDYPTGKI